MSHTYIDYLVRYYQENGLFIFGFNDLSGISFMNSFSHSVLLKSLSQNLYSPELKPFVVDGFQPFMCEPEHIDYFLNHNISLEELKLIKSSGVVGLLRKKMDDIMLPKELSAIGEISRLYYKLDNRDKNMFLRDILKNSSEPLILYCGGFYQLMQKIGSNSEKIDRDYLARDKRNDFNYTFDKIFEPSTIMSVKNNIQRNIEHFLSINPNADIMIIGSDMVNSNINIFNEFVLKYNHQLKEICYRYGLTYLDIIDIYNTKKSAREKIEDLSSIILKELYDLKRDKVKRYNVSYQNSFFESERGVSGVIDDVTDDFYYTMKRIDSHFGYDKEIEIDKASRQLQYKRVMEKVLRRTGRNI